MSWTFSKRCSPSLKSQKLKVILPGGVRVRIYKAFESNNEYWNESNDGYNYTASFLSHLEEDLQSELGIKIYMVYSQKVEDEISETNDFQTFVEQACIPSQIFDAIEIYYNIIGDKNISFQSRINSIMDENDLAWRMVDGKLFPIDSAYIEDEILRKTHQLIHENSFHGALQEFEKARTLLINEDYKGAIHNANSALESTIKGILKVQKKKPGELLRLITDAGILPDYFPEFAKFFETNLLVSVSKMRNEMAGHGQGVDVTEVPKPVAELSIHLTAILINFLIQRHLEIEG